jgi:hypothetical protein
MDHSEAIRLQAAEKYVLGELPKEVQDSFEEHFFDCGECATDVRSIAAFVEAGRQVLRTEPVEVAATRTAENRGGWLFWLRPAFAVPALLILLAVVGYQNLITFPKLRSGEAADTAQVFNSFSLVAANLRSARGEGAVKVQVQKHETFALDFDFLPMRPFDHYLCQLQDETGRVVLQAGVPAEKAKQEVHLLVPGGLERPGKYSVVLAGDPGAKGSWLKDNEVSRLNFVVDFRP